MIELFQDRLAEIWLRTGEHLILAGVSTGFAILAGVPLGIVAARVTALRGLLLGAVSVLQTVPSLAMLAILLVLLNKIGAIPAILALTLYALLPIVRNTVTGLERISPEILEAADGIGMTERQQLCQVKIPLALPVVIAGIRTAAVIGVGIATLAALIGAGGLGDFIIRGLALSDFELVLLGAIPAALLALLVDASIAAAEWGLRPVRLMERGTLKVKLRPLALACPVLVIGLGVAAYFTELVTDSASTTSGSGATTLRIASKNFTEQFILSEVMAQLIEARTDLSVERRFGLGGTMIAHEALTRGEVDAYVEYTGTGLTTILDRPVVTDPDTALEIVRDAYRKRFDVEWLDPFGFDNSYVLAARAHQAEASSWQEISDLAEEAAGLRAGFTGEFVERRDGYPALQETYGFRFGDVRDLDPSILYEAVARGEVDVISAFATDGRIEAYDLVTLADDRNAFPPYHAAPVVRSAVLEAHPELRYVLGTLSGVLSDSLMRGLNYQVDELGESPERVAAEFLLSHEIRE